MPSNFWRKFTNTMISGKLRLGKNAQIDGVWNATGVTDIIVDVATLPIRPPTDATA